MTHNAPARCLLDLANPWRALLAQVHTRRRARLCNADALKIAERRPAKGSSEPARWRISMSHLDARYSADCASVAVARPGARRTLVCARATWRVFDDPRPIRTASIARRSARRNARLPELLAKSARPQDPVAAHAQSRTRTKSLPELYSESQCGGRSRYNLSFSCGSGRSPQAMSVSSQLCTGSDC